jgi:hypothetical protein
LDEEHFQHVIYGINQILMILKEGNGLNKENLTEAGKILLRLSRITGIYVQKKNVLSKKEFAILARKLVDSLLFILTRV